MTNRQAIAYMLLACKQVGLEKEKVKELYQAMYTEFDHKTEEEAEEDAYLWYYEDVEEG